MNSSIVSLFTDLLCNNVNEKVAFRREKGEIIKSYCVDNPKPWYWLDVDTVILLLPWPNQCECNEKV